MRDLYPEMAEKWKDKVDNPPLDSTFTFLIKQYVTWGGGWEWNSIV